MQKILKIYRKIGNWEVGLIEYNDNKRVFLFVRGNNYGENPILYTHKQAICYDKPEKIPQSVKNYIFTNYNKILKDLK